MDYTVKTLAELTGLTPRTLRYYDAVGLLCPQRNEDNGYRLYGPAETARLADILLYRNMGMSLEEIGRLLDDPGYNRKAALETHLHRLEQRQRETEALIRTVKQTICELKGETDMTDKETFESMRAQALRENRANYGEEARKKYGSDAVDHADHRIGTMDREE